MRIGPKWTVDDVGKNSGAAIICIFTWSATSSVLDIRSFWFRFIVVMCLRALTPSEWCKNVDFAQKTAKTASNFD